MKSLAQKVILVFSSIRLVPHICLMFWSAYRQLIASDLERWASIKSKMIDATKLQRVYVFIEFMTFYPEFRSQFYSRLGWHWRFLRFLCSPMPTLYIYTRNIGPGLFIQHGFSTIIAAKSIGKNCSINQQVTIGYSNDHDRPTIGDNVVITAGAKVIGAVQIGSNSKIGANAVVVKNVPENCTVVGVPAYIVRRNGAKCKEPL